MASKYTSSSHDSFGSETRTVSVLKSKLSPSRYLRCVVEMLDDSETEINVDVSTFDY